MAHSSRNPIQHNDPVGNGNYQAQKKAETIGMIRRNPGRIKSMSLSTALKFVIAGAVVVAVASLGDGASGNERALAGKPDLPFGDINILVVSDVHSHVGGHPHEPDRNADYGDLLSFHERLKAHCENSPNGDLWLFNNGDILHGTGLAMDGNSTNLLPIVNAMPWDSLTMGRQEATYSDVLRDMSENVLPVFPGKYITSNVVWNETKKPYGERYQLLKGRNSTILVFGFLYDTIKPSETIQVIPVQETIQQDWFRSILRQQDIDKQYDAIVVMAHMDNNDPSINDIYEGIRSKVDPQMPIQFITGHSHKRELTDRMKRNGVRGWDQYVHRIEPGGLFDTIGWITIPRFDTIKRLPEKGNQLEEKFRQEFLNTSKTLLHSRLGLKDDEELRTDRGNAVSKLIHDTQERLGLNQIVACPGRDYFRNISIHADNSLWRLWRDHVVRTEIFKKDEDRVMIVSKSTFRYDLRGSGKHDAMTLDDVVAIAPYMERVVYVGDVPDWMVRRMNNTFNTFSHHNIIPDYVLAGDLDNVKTAESYKLYTHEVDVPKIIKKLEQFNFHDFVLKPTGQRDTLYWLDYVRSAYPCQGSEKETFVEPYFYDPNELEEEATDGKLSFEDVENDIDDETKDDSDADGWTLPPDGGYQGYIPGKFEGTIIPASTYENYKSKDQKDKEAADAKREELNKLKGNKGFKSQLGEHKKAKKKIIKGFALSFAGVLLLIPIVCMILQITGQNEEEDEFGDGGINGMYDPEEMMLLQRNRRRGTPPTKGRNLPLKEIEIL